MFKVGLSAAAAIVLGGAIHADPTAQARGDRLSPAHEKQSTIPPGQAKKTWHRGEALPVRYRNARISDLKRHDLRQPPEGYRWVRVEDEAYLIHVTSGIIAEAVSSAFS
ncbi:MULTISPECIES: RcnB family protein [Henriciella]|jgi:Ni/Co efflux regulator RcnB|uniref:Regulator RcnB of Ni and Co efflux n=1 Tax=Henriciella pelagia TaxID=1977912 RepID=A0ABQ1JRD8_9PROT|nr:RcnB family protein [Henriciella pelagia]GGB73674.1 hypothetical protein GCM10011503_22980 [Henriciella pelagia]